MRAGEHWPDQGWVDLREAVAALTTVRENDAARAELIVEMQAARLRSRAQRWVEEGAPQTWRARAVAQALDEGGTEIPSDFWQFSHRFDGSKAMGTVVAGTEADWALLRFETCFEVEGGRPNWSDRWGARRPHMNWKVWIWKRVAVGISVEVNMLREILSAYGVPLARSDTLAPRGYAIADAPLIARALELLKTGAARSVNDAAVLLAPEAKGASFEAKRDRLRRAIGKRLRSPDR